MYEANPLSFVAEQAGGMATDGMRRIVEIEPQGVHDRTPLIVGSTSNVGEAMRFYKLEPGDVTIFHDELGLAPGKVRVKQGGGHAGHNGLRSLHQHIGETLVGASDAKPSGPR